MPASNAQVQSFVNEVSRVLSEKTRETLISYEDAIARIDDVYANLTDSPTWTDSRTDAPPHLLTPSDVLAIHAFVSDIKAAMRNHAQLPVVLKACVRAI